MIPLVGYLIIFNDQITGNSKLFHDLFDNPPAISFRLLSMYFGLCFVAFSSSLFALRCPLEIKKYASAEEFIATEEPFIGEIKREIIINTVKRNIDELRVSSYTNKGELMLNYGFAHTGPTAPESREEKATRKASDLRFEMEIYYAILDQDYCVSRQVTGVSYVIGFVFLLCPAISVFLRVAQLLVKEIGHLWQ
jgi:hypothetical protein